MPTLPAVREIREILQHKDDFIDTDPYMASLAIPVRDSDRSRVSKTDWFLPYALDVPELEWKVSPKLEIADGAECHVLESKYRQRIWVDPKIGYAIRFRERDAPIKDKSADQWPLGERHAFGSYRKFTGEIWLPERIVAVGYADTTVPENLWNRVSRRSTLQVTKLAVNDNVPDSLFTMSFPPGTFVMDEVHNRNYRIGKSNEELDVLVQEGRGELPGSPSRRSWVMILLNVVAIIALASLFVYWKVAKKRRAAH